MVTEDVDKNPVTDSAVCAYIQAELVCIMYCCSDLLHLLVQETIDNLLNDNYTACLDITTLICAYILSEVHTHCCPVLLHLIKVEKVSFKLV